MPTSLRNSIFLLLCLGSFCSRPGYCADSISADNPLEQGKALYDKGQYVAALDKFMKVLRRDPQDPEARKYLRMVVDSLRSKGRAPRATISNRSLPEPTPHEDAVPSLIPVTCRCRLIGRTLGAIWRDPAVGGFSQGDFLRYGFKSSWIR